MPTISPFIGTIPRQDVQLLPENAAALAHNCKLERGHISPLHTMAQVAACSDQTATSLYRMRDGELLFFPEQVDAIESAVTASKKIFITGSEFPKQYSKEKGYSRLGVPQPATPLTIGLSVAEDDADIVRSSSYVYTYVTEDGAESEPSAPTAVVDVKEGQHTILSGFALPDLDGVSIAAFRLYRTNTGTSGAEFQIVPFSADAADIPVQTVTFTDAVEDVDLSSEVLVTEGWERLPDGAHSIALGVFGIYFAALGKDVYVSETNIPYAYPPAYRRAVPYNIVALAVADASLFVLTTGTPYALTGSTPDAMGQTAINAGQACVAKESVQAIGGGVLYATPDGVGFLSPAGFKLVTQDVYTRTQWRELTSSTMIGAVHDGEYLLFRKGCSDGLIYNMERGDIRTFDFGITVYDVHRDLEEDVLYILGEQGGTKAVYLWEGGELVPYEWRSKEFYLPTALNIGVMRVSGDLAADKPCIVAVRSLHTEQTLNLTRSDMAVRLQSGIASNVWSIALSGKATIIRLQFGTSVEAMSRGQ